MTNSERINVVEAAEEIKRGNERRATEVPDETKQDLSAHALELMAIESAINSAS